MTNEHHQTARAIALELLKTDTADEDETVRVSVSSIGALTVKLAHLKGQVDDLHRANSVLHAKAEAARAEVACMRDVVKLNGADALADMTQRRDTAVADRDRMWVERDLMRVERDEAIKHRDGMLRRASEAYPRCDRALRPMFGECLADAAERVVRERDEARAALSNACNERDGAIFRLNAAKADADAERSAMRAELASVTASRDALANACAVPVELARLYKAAQGALNKFGRMAQRRKLLEECGECVTEMCRDFDRLDKGNVFHEIHDVLTVALSLCEPALMAKAAERLEGRLAK